MRSWRLGLEINVQGNAYDTRTKDSTKEIRDVTRVHILNSKMIKN